MFLPKVAKVETCMSQLPLYTALAINLLYHCFTLLFYQHDSSLPPPLISNLPSNAHVVIICSSFRLVASHSASFSLLLINTSFFPHTTHTLSSAAGLLFNS